LDSISISLTKRKGHVPSNVERLGKTKRFSTTSSGSSLDENAWKQLSKEETTKLLQTAQAAARAAGEIISTNVGCSSLLTENFVIKTNIKDIVTQYDKQAQVAVEDIVGGAFPEHSFLGEEDVDPGASASEAALLKALGGSPSGYIWICDPIDGTANFAAGLDLCAVTMGVVYKGVPIVGVVYDPHKDEMFSAIKGQGATLNGVRLDPPARAVTSAKDAIINAGCPADPNAFATSMRGVLALNGRSRGLRVIACSALTTAWIAAGRLGAHFGYDLSSWDLVAGALLIQESGGMVTDLDGSPYKLTTRSMLCSNGLVHDEVLQILHDAGAVSFTRSE
jgi:myo-inositol-1(or 4)-monophosphatase